MKRFFWPVLLICLLGTLTVAAWPSSAPPPTKEQRVTALAQEIRCPTCRGLSVSESDTPLAESSRDEIIRRVDQGQSNKAIKAFFVSKYGETALMSPPRSGTTAIVWLLPVIGAVLALLGLYLAVRKWGSDNKSRQPSPDERHLVEQALQGR